MIRQNSLYIMGGLVAILVVLVFSLFVLRKNTRAARRKFQLVDAILQEPGPGLEDELARLLGTVMPLVQAPGYYFYLLDEKGANYVLKLARTATGEASQVESAGYSDISARGERYAPPLGIAAANLPAGAATFKEGSVPLLALPLNPAGMILAGPVRRVSKSQFRMLRFLAERLKPVVETRLQLDAAQKRLTALTASSSAVQSITRSALDYQGSFSAILALSVRMVGAAGACLVSGHQDETVVQAVLGLPRQVEELCRQDQATHSAWHKLTKDQEVVLITRDSPEYRNMPVYLTQDMESLLLVRDETNVIAFWFPSAVPEQHRIAAVQVLALRVRQIMEDQTNYKLFHRSYLDALRLLVSTFDNLDPFSVGHSELVSRYAGIIAKEMNMSAGDVNDVLMAGYFHDLGMLGLSGDIVLKAGRFSDPEYETMKLHAEVGAGIVESTLGNAGVSSYVRHHHERWDGYGYPAGLKGEDIPAGARIITVADVFNAKLTGRKYRPPATFERAVRDLQDAAGSQLDPAMVKALIAWFAKKQKARGRRECSLGPCWSMRCSPAFVCGGCPVFQRPDAVCWQSRDVKCEAHGNHCATCFIHTEYLYRARPDRH